jgi:hypothetical protein
MANFLNSYTPYPVDPWAQVLGALAEGFGAGQQAHTAWQERQQQQEMWKLQKEQYDRAKRQQDLVEAQRRLQVAKDTGVYYSLGPEAQAQMEIAANNMVGNAGHQVPAGMGSSAPRPVEPDMPVSAVSAIEQKFILPRRPLSQTPISDLTPEQRKAAGLENAPLNATYTEAKDFAAETRAAEASQIERERLDLDTKIRNWDASRADKALARDYERFLFEKGLRLDEFQLKKMVENRNQDREDKAIGLEEAKVKLAEMGFQLEGEKFAFQKEVTGQQLSMDQARLVLEQMGFKLEQEKFAFNKDMALKQFEQGVKQWGEEHNLKLDQLSWQKLVDGAAMQRADKQLTLEGARLELAKAGFALEEDKFSWEKDVTERRENRQDRLVTLDEARYILEKAGFQLKVDEFEFNKEMAREDLTLRKDQFASTKELGLWDQTLKENQFEFSKLVALRQEDRADKALTLDEVRVKLSEAGLKLQEDEFLFRKDIGL